MKWFRKFGPGLLVTAAFIGPGTVMTASRAGAEYGFALIWAIVFSVLATITLQWMAAKLGLVTRQGLTVNIQQALPFPAWKTISIFLMVSAIVVGNSAYQTGNVLGAALGLEILFGGNGDTGRC
ncbi:MAG: divalent metal cation transporter [Pirellulaceae bacterium]